jgi:hypothetical protein
VPGSRRGPACWRTYIAQFATASPDAFRGTNGRLPASDAGPLHLFHEHLASPREWRGFFSNDGSTNQQGTDAHDNLTSYFRRRLSLRC